MIIRSDTRIYYSYLPAAFIYNDLTFDRSEDLIKLFGKEWKNTAPNGNKVVKMTMGNAVCWLPFFGLAHLYSELSPWPSGGFSEPYHMAIFVSALFYLFVGLFFLRKLLLKYFGDLTVSIVIIVIVFGTNLYYYAVDEPGMSHLNSFSLIIVFLYFSLSFVKNPARKNAILSGALLGLISLIRPTNVIVGIIPLLVWFINHRSTDRKLTNLKENAVNIILLIVFFLLLFSPQMIYWKIQTGQFFYNSYHEEGFFFFEPHIIDGLFSYRKGWLIYTPVMFFSIAGFFFMRNRASGLRIPLLVFFVLFIYLVFSWWCWWYGGGFGSRPMIDTYGVLAISMAASVDFLIRQNTWIKAISFAVLVFLISLNIFQVSQYRKTLIHYDGMTKSAYWAVFLKKEQPTDYEKLIDNPDYESALKGGDE
ncbi:MAG: hypothetical protein U5Q03_16805 [Bacteroidota bacterium]|nr:hypothetical protein [Bacteroidota bacterium]